MKKALLITAYRSPSQLRRLASAVRDAEMDCFVHVDRKSDIAPFEAAVRGLDHVFFVPDHHSVSLEHSSHVFAILAAARLAMRHGSYGYFISLTGQCYPLASNDEISAALDTLYPQDIIDSRICVPGCWCAGWGRWRKLETSRAIVQGWLGKDHYETWHGKLARLPLNLIEIVLTLFFGRPKDRLEKLGYRYSAGSHMWMLSDNAMNFILERAENDRALMKIFRGISTPEESSFQTVLTAAEFSGTRAKFEKHHISNDPGLNRMERSDIQRFICDARGMVNNLRHPLVVTMQEREFISRSRALFGRKFDETEDSEILDFIDALRALPPQDRAALASRPL